MNIVPVTVSDGGVMMGDHHVPIERSLLDKVRSGTAQLGVRPEDLHLSDTGAP